MPTPSLLLSAALAAGAAVATALAPSPVPEIVSKSVVANTHDWQAQDNFAYDECDVKSKVDSSGHAKSEGSKTYAVLMINGSPYRRLVRINNEPLTRAQEQQEQAKLEREIALRRSERSSARSSRVNKYREQRAEEHLLMEQMAVAFDFRLLGHEDVNGVACFHFQAVPKPDYQPPVEKARVLKGMRGQMWIDQRQFHWVKVKAEVMQPVSFGFFIAKVNPGTRFELDQAPVGDVWLPKHFVQTVNASVFGVYGYRTQDEFYYSDYKELKRAELRAAVR